MTLHQATSPQVQITDRPGRQARPVPKVYRALGAALNSLGLVSPNSAGRLLNRMWFTPVHGRPSQSTVAFWNSADHRLPLTTATGGLDLYCWGKPSDPVIWGVHGWRGSGTQFRRLIPPLVGAGYRVCLFDLPGHGLNPTRPTHLYEFVKVLLAIQDLLGRPSGIIAHSLGCQTVVQAVEQGLNTKHLVLVSPGLSIESMVDHFSRLIGISNRVKQRFEQALTSYSITIAKAYLGQSVPIWERLNHDFARRHLTHAGLMVADRDDEEVGWAEFEQTAGYWSNAETMITEGLGHYRILKDDGVIKRIAVYFTERR